jgi:hypothetical protein
MTTQTRASIFDADELDVSGFAPKTTPDSGAPSQEQVRAVSEAANFRSREPAKAQPLPQLDQQPVSPKRLPRRHRTGRNVQFNVKASHETVAAFYEISDRNDWVLGETLEKALAALQRELTSHG